MSALRSHLVTAGFGAPTAELALKGTFGGAPALLCRTDTHLLLASADDQGARHHDLLADPTFRYQIQSTADRLVTAAGLFSLPARSGAEVKRWIAELRLPKPQGDEAQRFEPRAPFVERPSAFARQALLAVLQPGEEVYVYLPSGSARRIPSPIAEALPAPVALWVTDRRAGCLAVTALGDVERIDLERFELDGTRLVLGTASLPLARRTVARLAPILPLLERTPEERRLGFGCLELAAKGDPAVPRLRKLYATPRARLALALHGHEALAPDLFAALAAERPDASALVELFGWLGTPRAERQAVLDPLAATTPASFWLPLLRHLRTTARPPKAEAERVRGDLDFAAALIAAENRDEATKLLEQVLTQLPPPELTELLPQNPSAPSNPRTRALELLGAARSQGPDRGQDDLASVHELARLEPFSKPRLAALVRTSQSLPGDLAARAAKVEALLEPGALCDSASEAPPRPRKLEAELLERAVRHPSTQKGRPIGRLQALLAQREVPSAVTLRAFCERLGADHQEAEAALADVVWALGLKSVEAYVSRGVRSIGVAAYEHQPSFLLIGQKHLDPETPFFLGPRALRFALGAELAHLRFDHARVTGREVMEGAVQKSRLGAEVLLGLLPLLKGVKLADQLRRIAELYQRTALGKVIAEAEVVRRRLEKIERRRIRRDPEQIGARNEELVMAHRAMQLSADRAGLVLAQDLGVAIRTIFLLRSDYRAELPVVLRHGLAESLSRVDASGRLVYMDLSIRVAALLAFYLSDEYAEASAALAGAALPRANQG